MNEEDKRPRLTVLWQDAPVQPPGALAGCAYLVLALIVFGVMLSMYHGG